MLVTALNVSKASSSKFEFIFKSAKHVLSSEHGIKNLVSKDNVGLDC